jgi:hypothetical protein
MADPVDSAKIAPPAAPTPSGAPDAPDYEVTDQIGHLLRRAHQRASSVFQNTLDDPALTPMQFAALMKLRDGPGLSQNHLGRQTAMDPATVQGVIRRLEERGLIDRQAVGGSAGGERTRSHPAHVRAVECR